MKARLPYYRFLNCKPEKNWIPKCQTLSRQLILKGLNPKSRTRFRLLCVRGFWGLVYPLWCSASPFPVSVGPRFFTKLSQTLIGGPSWSYATGGTSTSNTKKRPKQPSATLSSCALAEQPRTLNPEPSASILKL